MRKPHRFALGAGVGLAIGGALLAFAPVEFAFEPVELTSEPGTARPVNALGNDVDDVAIAWQDQFLFARLSGRRPIAYGPGTCRRTVTVAGTVDLDGDGLDEVGLAVRDTSGERLVLVDPSAGAIDTLGPFRGAPHQGEPWVGAIEPVGVVGRADGARVLLASVYGARRPPRELLAYDLRRRQVLWELPFGAFPSQARVLPRSAEAGDARPILVMGTAATDNAHVGPPLDDNESYLFAVDSSGARVWTLQTGGMYSAVKFVELPARSANDTSPLLFVAMHEHRAENPSPARVFVVDARDGRIVRERSFPTSFSAPQLFGHAPLQVVVGDDEGTLRVFDDRLRVTASRSDSLAIAAWGCRDLDGDGETEVIASTEREGLVLDARLRVRGRFPLHGSPRIPVPLSLRRRGLAQWAILSTDTTAVRDWTPRRVVPLREPRRWSLAGALAVLLGALSLTPWPVRRRGDRAQPAHVREFLVDHMQIHHEVFDTKGPVEALRRWVQQRHAGLPVVDDPRESARDHLQLIGVPALHRFLARAAAVRVDESRHAAATRLLDAVERSVSGRALSPEDAGRVVQALNELQGACAALHREVGERLACRPDVAAQDALRARQRELVSAGVASSCTCAPRAAVFVVFDPDELREIVGQLLENAMRQLARREGAAVRVDVMRDESDPRWVTIAVADNGPGVPADLRERIFDAGWSTRRKGGFGLAHARDLARAWRGSLVLAEREAGACFQLRVRVLDPFGSGGA